MDKPAAIRQLQTALGLELEPFPGPPEQLEELTRYRYQNHYALDAEGREVIGLNLRSNGLNDAQFGALAPFTQLQALNLSENDFTRLALPAEWADLRYVDLSENKALKQLDFHSPHTLPLEWLDLNECALEQLEVPAFLRLQKLDLSRNQLRSLRFQGACPALWMLDASKNQMKAFELPGLFGALKYLYLNDNQLAELRFQGDLPALEILHLRNNQLENLPANLRNSARLEALYLHGNPLSQFPKEAIDSDEEASSKDSIWAIWEGEAKSKGKTEPLYEAKMVLVGNGEVGKSSIRIKLIDRDADLPKEPDRTPGLEVVKYDIRDLAPALTGLDDKIDFRLNIWDFGGQGHYREIQQFFCSRKTLYLFVTSTDNKPGQDDYADFNYWLFMVNAFGFDDDNQKHCPVIYVVNKTDLIDAGLVDKRAADINEKKTSEDFPNIEYFAKISCLKKKGLGDLEDYIQKSLKNISADIFLHKGFPPHWIKIKNWLESLKPSAEAPASEGKYYIPYQDYEAECRKPEFGLSENEARQWLVILDRIGAVIYQEKHPELRNWIILDPNWIKQSMVTVLDCKKIRNGVLIPEQFEMVWEGSSPEEQRIFIDMMLAYRLCYQREDSFGNIEYIIPAKLPAEAKPLGPVFQQPAFKLKLHYEPFIPAGTINKLIVALHSKRGEGQEMFRNKEGEGKDGRPLILRVHDNLMWKNNVVVHAEGTNNYAHVYESWNDHSVYIDLFGDVPKDLYDALKSILTDEANTLKESRYMARLDIKAYGYDDNDPDKWVPLKYKPDFFDQPNRKPSMKKRKVFVSYAHADDRDYYEKFLSNIKAHTRQHWDIFTDEDIPLGEKWEAYLEKQADQCDLAILLVSPNFFNSEFIRQKEFGAFIRRRQNSEFKFFSLRLRNCRFDQWPELKETQMFMPYGRHYGFEDGPYADEPISFALLVDKDKSHREYLNQYCLDFYEKVEKVLNPTI